MILLCTVYGKDEIIIVIVIISSLLTIGENSSNFFGRTRFSPTILIEKPRGVASSPYPQLSTYEYQLLFKHFT